MESGDIANDASRFLFTEFVGDRRFPVFVGNMLPNVSCTEQYFFEYHAVFLDIKSVKPTHCPIHHQYLVVSKQHFVRQKSRIPICERTHTAWQVELFQRLSVRIESA